MEQIAYRRDTPDERYGAWYIESWYYGHHYRYYSYSPRHNVGSGTRFETEEAARAMVDWYMDTQVPLMMEGR